MVGAGVVVAGRLQGEVFTPIGAKLVNRLSCSMTLCRSLLTARPKTRQTMRGRLAMWHSQFEYGLSAYAHVEGNTATPPQTQSESNAWPWPLQVLA